MLCYNICNSDRCSWLCAHLLWAPLERTEDDDYNVNNDDDNDDDDVNDNDMID